MKTLLVFAHKAEAYRFLSEENFEKNTDGFYQGSHDILITGNGRNLVMIELTKALATNKYDQVINLGVCASLDSNISKHEIVEVRTVYGHNGSKPLFHSFTTSSKNGSKNSTTDIISTDERALNTEVKKQYQPFAPLLDQEAWAVGYCCQKFKIPFKCIKIVSDELNEEDFCQIVKEQAHEFSNKLFKYYRSIEEDKVETNKDDSIDLDSFYLTRAQALRVEKLLETAQSLLLKSSQEIIQAIEIDQSLQPKSRTKALIEELEKITNPLKYQISKQFRDSTNILRAQNIEVRHDPKFESTEISLNIKLRNKDQLTRVIESLKTWDYQKTIDIFNGKLKEDLD